MKLFRIVKRLLLQVGNLAVFQRGGYFQKNVQSETELFFFKKNELFTKPLRTLEKFREKNSKTNLLSLWAQKDRNVPVGG